MAKEEKKKGEREGGEKKKPAKKHLHSIHTEQAEDGSYVHHHTYKAKKSDAHTEPTRMNAATSQSPDEAGQHVAEQFAMNDQGAGGGQQEEEPEAAGAPDAGGGAAAMPGQ